MYEYNIKITRVIDGDTVDGMIDLGFHTHTSKRVRFVGINAPETRTRDKAEKEKGIIAKNWLKQLVEENDEFIIVSHGTGKFGRVLGELYVVKGDRKQSVNKMMLNAGLVVEYHGGAR